MKFQDLYDLIPFARFGKAKSLTMQPYNGITLALPGRHSEDTTPKGGDFVVMVDDDKINWTRHQFTHNDIFRDIENKREASFQETSLFMDDYYKIITGADPAKMDWHRLHLDGCHPQTLLYALQCLAVAEHRRYSMHEARFGGRYLPFRFAAGIAEGLWDASDAIEKQRRGRPGVEWLEKDHGVPTHTQTLLQGV